MQWTAIATFTSHASATSAIARSLQTGARSRHTDSIGAGPIQTSPSLALTRKGNGSATLAHGRHAAPTCRPTTGTGLDRARTTTEDRTSGAPGTQTSTTNNKEHPTTTHQNKNAPF